MVLDWSAKYWLDQGLKSQSDIEISRWSSMVLVHVSKLIVLGPDQRERGGGSDVY